MYRRGFDDDLAGGLMSTAMRDYGGRDRDFGGPRIRSLSPPRRRYGHDEPHAFRRLPPRDPSPPRRRFLDPSPSRRYRPRDLTPPGRYRDFSPPGRFRPRMGFDGPLSNYREGGYNVRDSSPRRPYDDGRYPHNWELPGSFSRGRPVQRRPPPIRRDEPRFSGGWF